MHLNINSPSHQVKHLNQFHSGAISSFGSVKQGSSIELNNISQYAKGLQGKLLIFRKQLIKDTFVPSLSQFSKTRSYAFKKNIEKIPSLNTLKYKTEQRVIHWFAIPFIELLRAIRHLAQFFIGAVYLVFKLLVLPKQSIDDNALKKELEITAFKVQRIHQNIKNKVKDRNISLLKLDPIFMQGKYFMQLFTAPKPLENLIFRGGGVLGEMYPRVIQMMLNHNYLKSLKTVVGSSSGSIIAALMGAGLSTVAMEEFFTLLKGAAKSDEGIHQLYPDVIYRKEPLSKVMQMLDANTSSQGLGCNADYFLYILDFTLSHHVSLKLNALLNTINEEELTQKIKTYVINANSDTKTNINIDTVKLDSIELDRKVAYLRNRIDVLLNSALVHHDIRQGKMLTFEDAHFLHYLYPNEFKQIAMSVFDKKSKKSVIFNAKNTPNLPVAYGVRVSIAHPLFMTPCSFKYGKNINESSVFNDGGIASEVPVEALFDGDVNKAIALGIENKPQNIEIQAKKSKTNVLVFNQSGLYNEILNSPSFVKRQVTSTKYVPWHLRLFNVTSKNRTNDAKKIYSNNTYVLNHGKLHAHDISPSSVEIEHAKQDALLSFLHQFSKRKNSSSQFLVQTPKEAFQLLSSDEKRNISTWSLPSKKNTMSSYEYDFLQNLIVLCKNDVCDL